MIGTVKLTGEWVPFVPMDPLPTSSCGN